MDELLYSLWLAAALGPGNPRSGELLSLYGTARAVFEARGREDLSALVGRASVERLQNTQPEEQKPLLERCRALGCTLLPYEDERYPLAFTRIPDPPVLLFCTGDPACLNDHTFVGMVGSRRPTQYGMAVCAALGRDLAAAGAVLVSGLADGLDGEAHRAAVDAKAPTVGILGCSIDRTYPAGNRTLRLKMEQRGCVLSEYAPGAESGRKFQFLQRNRLIAALSDALCVVEAREKSGTMDTVGHAERYGRPVYAVPGSIFSNLSQGTNDLLRTGRARALCSAAQLLAELGLAAPARTHTAAEPRQNLSAAARAVLACLGPVPVGLEALCESTGLGVGEILGALTELELAAQATPLPGRRYLPRQ